MMENIIGFYINEKKIKLNKMVQEQCRITNKQVLLYYIKVVKMKMPSD